MVHSAGTQDRDGGISLLATMKGLFPFLEKLFADSAYQGPLFAKALAKILPCLKTEIVKRSDHARGFVQLSRRWIVERAIAWLNRRSCSARAPLPRYPRADHQPQDRQGARPCHTPIDPAARG